jgi:hypothetical protein
MTALIFTFGKHRGEPVSVVRNDPGYAFWLLSLHWFRERHPQLRQAVAREVIQHLRDEVEREEPWPVRQGPHPGRPINRG